MRLEQRVVNRFLEDRRKRCAPSVYGITCLSHHGSNWVPQYGLCMERVSEINDILTFLYSEEPAIQALIRERANATQG